MAVIATGFFDGVHPGHRLVIDTLLSEASRRGEESVVVTFWPHPRAVLQSDAPSLRYLSSRSERESALRELGVTRVETVRFSREFASLPASGYVEMLRSRFGASALVLGYDTRFGSDRSGPEEIAREAASLGIDAVITPPVLCGGSPVSSSRIRTALEDGDAVWAAELLGRPYRLHGVVVEGNHIGRTIGFPTANMQLYEPLMCIPRNGVYETRVYMGAAADSGFAAGGCVGAAIISGGCEADGVSGASGGGAAGSEHPVLAGAALLQEPCSRCFRGLTNIGVRPTVGGGACTIETHILGFDEMIYGLDITIEFVARIRDERRFDSLDSLRLQLESDLRSLNSII